MKTGATDGGSLPPSDRRRVAELYALLSQCFQYPDSDFVDAVQSGQFEATLRDRLDPLDLTVESLPTDDLDELREAYLRTFEAYEGGYAPPAESAYEEWWDGTDRELLSGPAAHDMRRRYEAVDADVPPEYPADHVSLLLEYGSLLLEAGDEAEYARFHEEHFDWIPSFRERVEETADSPFYRWAVETLADVIEAAAVEFGIRD